MNKYSETETRVFGVRVSVKSKEKLLEYVSEWIEDYNSGRLALAVATVNPEFILEAQSNPEFKNVLNSFDVLVADGSGLKLASKDIKYITPGRDLVKALISNSEYKVYYLGGRNGVAEKMAKKYRRKNDKLDNWDEGFENISAQISDTDLNQKIVDKINKYQPDILLVAYGAPWQELWMWKNKNKLKAKVMIGVGGTFDYLTGQAKEPPKLISRLGFEWLWRLIHQPWRWRRQIRLVKYLLMCLKQQAHE